MRREVSNRGFPNDAANVCWDHDAVNLLRISQWPGWRIASFFLLNGAHELVYGVPLSDGKLHSETEPLRDVFGQCLP